MARLSLMALRCRVWSKKGGWAFISRELNRLADALDAASKGEDRLGQLAP